jgi:hypothetical protein
MRLLPWVILGAVVVLASMFSVVRVDAGPFDLVSFSTEADVGLQLTAAGANQVLNVPVSNVKGPAANFGLFLDVPLAAHISGDAFADAGLLEASGAASAAAFKGVNGSFAFGGGIASFTDYFIPESATLPMGTVVHAKGTLDISGLVDTETASSGTGGAGAHLVLDGVDTVSLADATGAVGRQLAQLVICAETLVRGTHFDCNFGDGVIPLGGALAYETSKSFTVDLQIGQTYALSSLVAAQVSVGASQGGFPDTDTAAASGGINALHSGHSFLEPLGDFVIVSASGHNYSPVVASVPAPGSAFLLATGLAGLFYAHRRRRAGA